jgi:hypothetical protein
MISGPSEKISNDIIRGRNNFRALNSSEATPPSSEKIPETKNVFLRYATADEGVKEEEFDMVVLSVGLESARAKSGTGGKIRY